MGLFDSDKYNLGNCDETEILAIQTALAMAEKTLDDRGDLSAISSARQKLNGGRRRLNEREFRITIASVLAILAVLQDKKKKGEGDSNLDSVCKMMQSAAESLAELL